MCQHSKHFQSIFKVHENTWSDFTCENEYIYDFLDIAFGQISLFVLTIVSSVTFQLPTIQKICVYICLLDARYIIRWCTQHCCKVSFEVPTFVNHFLFGLTQTRMQCTKWLLISWTAPFGRCFEGHECHGNVAWFDLVLGLDWIGLDCGQWAPFGHLNVVAICGLE